METQQQRPAAPVKVDEECERLLRALAPRLSELIRRKRKWKLEVNAAGNAPFAVVVTEYDSV